MEATNGSWRLVVSICVAGGSTRFKEISTSDESFLLLRELLSPNGSSSLNMGVSLVLSSGYVPPEF